MTDPLHLPERLRIRDARRPVQRQEANRQPRRLHVGPEACLVRRTMKSLVEELEDGTELRASRRYGPSVRQYLDRYR